MTTLYSLVAAEKLRCTLAGGFLECDEIENGERRLAAAMRGVMLAEIPDVWCLAAVTQEPEWWVVAVTLPDPSGWLERFHDPSWSFATYFVPAHLLCGVLIRPERVAET